MENLENTTAVTNEASASATDAPATETQAVEATTPAEVKNTDEKDLSGNPIPYKRFQEKVHEYNKLKEEFEKVKGLEKFKEFEAYDTETFKAYMNLDKMISENPDLYEQISKVIEGYSTKEKQIDENLDPTEAKIKQLEEQIKHLTTGVTKQTQEQVMNRYGSDFEALSKEKNLTPVEKDLMSYYTEVAMALKSPDYRNRYNPQMLKSAFESQYKRIEDIQKAAVEKYLQGKQEKQAPVNSGGMVGTQEPDMTNEDARRNFLLKELERIKGLNL